MKKLKIISINKNSTLESAMLLIKLNGLKTVCVLNKEKFALQKVATENGTKYHFVSVYFHEVKSDAIITPTKETILSET